MQYLKNLKIEFIGCVNSFNLDKIKNILKLYSGNENIQVFEICKSGNTHHSLQLNLIKMRFKSPLKINKFTEIEASNIYNFTFIEFINNMTHLTVLHLTGSEC